MIKHYETKLQYLNKHQAHICAISGKLMTFSDKRDLHHMHSRTKWAVKAYPLFIDSILNLRTVDHNAHMRGPGKCRMSSYNAERWEMFLQRHPKIAEWVNHPQPEKKYLWDLTSSDI